MDKISFKQIRSLAIAAGDIDSSCREVAPYYYSKNGGKGPRERSPGQVAFWILRKARAAGHLLFSAPYPAGSWCGNWPRTLASLRSEETGTRLFWQLVESLLAEGIISAE